MNLDSIIKENLDILLDLKNDDKLKTVDNKLIIDNEENSFQELNSPNLELVILNTFSMAFYLETNNLSDKDKLLNIINTCIDNVYVNKYLNDCNDCEESNTFFNDGLQKINHVYKQARNKYQRNKCNRFYYKLFDFIDILLIESIIICKSINESVIKYHMVIEDSDSDSDTDFKDDEDLVDEEDSVDKDSVDSVDKEDSVDSVDEEDSVDSVDEEDSVDDDSNDDSNDTNCSDIDITFINDKKLD